MATTTGHVQDVVAALNRATNHRRQSSVWDAFMAITHATLRMLPAHARALTETGAMAEDEDARGYKLIHSEEAT